MKDEVLERFYQENLDERLIAYLAKAKNLSLERAMDLYYRSELSRKIYEGLYGVQYLDYKVLARILQETEPELFVEEEREDRSADGRSGSQDASVDAR